MKVENVFNKQNKISVIPDFDGVAGGIACHAGCRGAPAVGGNTSG
jgi:hypothetical protein